MSKLRDEFDSAQIEAKWNGYQYILTIKSLDILEKIAKDLFLDLVSTAASHNVTEAGM